MDRTARGLTSGQGVRAWRGALMITAALGMALALAGPAGAQAYLVGTTASASTGADSNNVLYSYNYNELDQFPGAGYRYVPAPCGAGPNNNCSVGGTGPTTLADTLTAASVTVQASDTGIDFYSNPFAITASGAASANLATGALSIAAAGSPYPNSNWGVGQSQAVLYDTLTFNIPGAGPATVTDIAVSFKVTGGMTLSTYGYGSLGNTLRFGGGAFADTICAGCAGNETTTPMLSSSGATGWVSDSLSPDGLDFSGVVAVDGAAPVVTLEAYFGLSCANGASCGYDGQVSVTPPGGVSYVSASNVFLTQAAPEPMNWVLMLAGLGAVGGALRIRRRSGPRTVQAREPLRVVEPRGHV